MNAFQHGFAGERPGVGVGQGSYDKTALLAEYAARFHVKTLVETGLYQGRGSGMNIPVQRYIAIDWQQQNCDLLRELCPDAHTYCGDSAALLRWLLTVSPPTGRPVLFWLDAHALDADEGSPTVCPVLGELAAIQAWQHAGSAVVLVDDLWGMGTIRGWPSLDELRDAADDTWERSEEGGIMRLTPHVST